MILCIVRWMLHNTPSEYIDDFMHCSSYSTSSVWSSPASPMTKWTNMSFSSRAIARRRLVRLPDFPKAEACLRHPSRVVLPSATGDRRDK
jgi:hypothetical protein